MSTLNRYVILNAAETNVQGEARASSKARAARQQGATVDRVYDHPGYPMAHIKVVNTGGVITFEREIPPQPDKELRLKRFRQQIKRNTLTSVGVLRVLKALGLYSGSLPQDLAPRARLKALRVKIVDGTITDAERDEALRLLIAPDTP